MKSPLIQFVKAKRRTLGLTQRDLADRAGLGLRFIRDLEQGKESLRLDKVNHVLALFGHRMNPRRSAPGRRTMGEVEVLLHDRPVGIPLKNWTMATGSSTTPSTLGDPKAAPVSLSLPLRPEPFEDKHLFPLFRRAYSRRLAPGNRRKHVEAQSSGGWACCLHAAGTASEPQASAVRIDPAHE